MRRRALLFRGILIASAVGMALSAYLTANHYRVASTGFCTIGPGYSCDVVNTSSYSEILGMPVALIGFLGFAIVFSLAFLETYTTYELPLVDPASVIVILSVLGVGFGIYLTYVELFILRTICLLCVGSFGSGIAMLILSTAAVRWTRTS